MGMYVYITMQTWKSDTVSVMNSSLKHICTYTPTHLRICFSKYTSDGRAIS